MRKYLVVPMIVLTFWGCAPTPTQPTHAELDEKWVNDIALLQSRFWGMQEAHPTSSDELISIWEQVEAKVKEGDVNKLPRDLKIFVESYEVGAGTKFLQPDRMVKKKRSPTLYENVKIVSDTIY